jgi:hypothetical protein
MGYQLTGIHLVPVSPAQFWSGRISAISDRATNYLNGSPNYRASDFLSQRDTDLTLPLALACSSFFIAGHLFFGCAQYAAGSKKVSLSALSNEIFEVSGLHDPVRPAL